jgi:D-alanyl-lipoteichoic acid acyltransferase DltB (MBOAT superfamily)
MECAACLTDGGCAKMRNGRSLKTAEYSYLNYLIYCLYVPLYLAGPIITFNNFVSQVCVLT